MGNVSEKRDGPLIGNNVRVELVLVKFLNLTHCPTLTAIHKFSKLTRSRALKAGIVLSPGIGSHGLLGKQKGG